ncbi:hypothetical protein VUR80DRAFT_6460 [Thermomyces stellatus]
MHSAVAARQSPALAALVNAGFKEAANRCVEWEDVAEETFCRFWEFACSGNYGAYGDSSGLHQEPTSTRPDLDRLSAIATHYSEKWAASPRARKRTTMEAIHGPLWRGTLRFCCAETAPDRVRQTMAHYATCNAKTLWERQEFQELLEASGSLARALLGPPLLWLDP